MNQQAVAKENDQNVGLLAGERDPEGQENVMGESNQLQINLNNDGIDNNNSKNVDNNNKNKEQAAGNGSVSSKKNNNVCGFPTMMSVIIILFVVFVGMDTIGICMDIICSGMTGIEIDNTIFLAEITVGWNKMQTNVSVSIGHGYSHNENYYYSKECNHNNTNSKCWDCIENMDWCSLKKHGIYWFAGFWVRCVIAIIVIILLISMSLHHRKVTNLNDNENNLVNNNDASYGEMTTSNASGYVSRINSFYKNNKCKMVLTMLLLLLWIVCGFISLVLWGTNNPIYENEYTSVNDGIGVIALAAATYIFPVIILFFIAWEFCCCNCCPHCPAIKLCLFLIVFVLLTFGLSLIGIGI